MEEILKLLVLLLELSVAIVPFVVLVYKFIVKPIRDMSKKVDEFDNKLKVMDDDVKIIKAEIMVNSGSTIKDKVNAIMRNLLINDSRWKYSDDANIAQWECDETGKCVRANNSICHLFGLTPDQMEGFGWFEAIDPKDRNRIYEQWLYACKNAIPYQAKYTINNRDTETSYDIIAEGIPVVDTMGKLIHWFGTCKKVGSSKKKDAA